MLPRFPPLVRCPHCAASLWLPAAEEIGSEPPDETGTPGVEDPPDPDERDLLEALRTPPVGAQDKEMFIRIEAWHTANDPRRQDGHAYVALSPESEANMEILSRLLDSEDPGQKLMKAELYRELGLFDDTERLLDFPFEEEHVLTVKVIRNLARQANRNVVEISYG